MNDNLTGLLQTDKYVKSLNDTTQDWDIEFTRLQARVFNFLYSEEVKTLSAIELAELTVLVDRYACATAGEYMERIIELANSSLKITA